MQQLQGYARQYISMLHFLFSSLDECTDKDLENFLIMSRPLTMHMLPEPDGEDAPTDAGFVRKLQAAHLLFLCSNGTYIHCYAYQYVAKQLLFKTLSSRTWGEFNFYSHAYRDKELHMQ